MPHPSHPVANTECSSNIRIIIIVVSDNFVLNYQENAHRLAPTTPADYSRRVPIKEA
jgi:hypothetical protein